MAATFDAASGPTTGTGTLSWTHTPTGTPRGVAVLIIQNVTSTDEISSVTYGGVAMTQATGSPHAGVAGLEDGQASIWMLGSSVPSGAQTVTVNVNGSSAKAAACVTATANFNVIAADACSVHDSGVVSNIACASQTVHIQRGECLVLGCMLSGEDAVGSVAPDSGYVDLVTEHDFGSQTASWIRKSTNYPAGGGGTGNVGLWVQSSDEAHAICILLTEDAFFPIVGPATETDTAQAISKTKKKTLGQATESDSGQALGKAKSKAVAQATETDAAQAVGKVKTRAVGQAAETDSAQAVGHAKIKAVGQASEADAAQAVGKAKAKVVAQATESDSGQALGKAKSKAVAQATEVDTAQSATPVQSGGGQVIAVGQATETDSAQPLGKAKTKSVGQAVETDLAMALYMSGAPPIGKMITPGLPMWPLGIGATPLPAGKFRITWGYDPHGQGAWPVDFQVFESPVWDVPLVDSETGLNVVVFDVRRKQFSFTTAAYAGGSMHAFGVRARSSAGVAERNINFSATVTAKTAAPTSAKILQTMAAR